MTHPGTGPHPTTAPALVFGSDAAHQQQARQQDAQRLGLLDELGLVDPAAGFKAFAEFDTFAADLARAADAPYAMVNVRTDQQEFIGLFNAPGMKPVARTMRADHGYCPEVMQRSKALVLTDVCAHPRFQSNPVVDQIGIRTYAGAPLIIDDIVLGTVCFVGPETRPQSTGRPSLALIKARAEMLVDLLYQRAGRPNPRHHAHHGAQPPGARPPSVRPPSAQAPGAQASAGPPPPGPTACD